MLCIIAQCKMLFSQICLPHHQLAFVPTMATRVLLIAMILSLLTQNLGRAVAPHGAAEPTTQVSVRNFQADYTLVPDSQFYLGLETLPEVSLSRPGCDDNTCPWWVYGNTFGTTQDLAVGLVFRTMSSGPISSRMHCFHAGCNGADSMFADSSDNFNSTGDFYCAAAYYGGQSPQQICDQVAPGAFLLHLGNNFPFGAGIFLAGGFKTGGNRTVDASLSVYDIHFIYYGVLLDLSIDSIEPVQVLEGQDLVQNKSTAVKVVIKKTGSGMADNVSVQLNWSNGGSFSESRFYVAEDENIDADYSLMEDNAYYPLSFATNEITKTIFFFSENLAPINDTIQVSATVDHSGTIIEDDETNNTETISRAVYDVQWTSQINSGLANLSIHYSREDWGQTPIQDYEDYIQIANEFIRDVYPVSEPRFEYSVNNIGDDSALISNCDSVICMLFFLNFMMRRYTELRLESPSADRYIMMVPDGWICEKAPTQDCITTGMVLPQIPAIAIVQPGLTPEGRLPGGESAHVAAHEIGHSVGLPVHPCAEEYDGDCDGVPDRIGELAGPGLWVSRRIPIRVPYDREVFCFMGGGTANHDKKYWVDAEDYAKLFNDHKVVASSQVSISDEATQGILAAGTFDISGTATLDTWYVLSETELDTLAPGPYSFEYQDANGAILHQQSFAITYTVWGETFEQMPFVATIPYIPNTEKIVVKYNNVPLAEKIVSPNAPTVTVISPNGGEQLSGQVEISWTGTDADGDTLAYVVQLTLNNGASWTTLAAGIADTSHMLDVSQLPPGTQYRIKVIASDGFNTSQDVSDAPFTVLTSVYLPSISK